MNIEKLKDQCETERRLDWPECIAALAVIAIVSLAAYTSQTQAQDEVQIQCFNGKCVIGQATLEKLAQMAGKAMEYRHLCGWDK